MFFSKLPLLFNMYIFLGVNFEKDIDPVESKPCGLEEQRG